MCNEEFHSRQSNALCGNEESSSLPRAAAAHCRKAMNKEVSSGILREANLIDALRQQIVETLRSLLPEGSSCALLSFPHHANVGDSAIWVGATNVLRTLRAPLVYTCDIRSYRKQDLADAIGNGIILFTGGGSLGDIWPDYQDFRETVVGDFPNNTIIQLPETMGFIQSHNLRRTQRSFDKHRHLTLLLRDHRSLAAAQKAFRARTVLCPDMAFGMSRIVEPLNPSVPILWLQRSDIEANGMPVGFQPRGIEVTDWLDEGRDRWSSIPAYVSFRLMHSLSWRLGHRVDRGKSLGFAYDRLARRRVQRGCELLGQGRVVISDRLHGHILSLLLGLPHVVLDNNYGKVSAFFRTWTSKSKLARWADSPEEAIELAESLASDLQALPE
jgi:exopolysaccharide biosynthesis predicted pyruvyltransferase EpsI